MSARVPSKVSVGKDDRIYLFYFKRLSRFGLPGSILLCPTVNVQLVGL